MQFLILVLFASLVLFLFRLYHLAFDDYILVKKNIELDDVFNVAFACSLLALLFSRIFYVVINPERVFSSPLGFLLFPYFPGLSLTGGLFGGIVALFFLSRKKKFPIGRIFDFFSISFIFSLPFGFVGYLLLSQEFTSGNLVKLILYGLILTASNIYLYPKASLFEIKDGTISALFLVFFSLISLLTRAIDHPGTMNFITYRENFVLLLILISGVLFILKQEIIGRISIKDGK
ncbi:MAG: prolipoprotein diacylglyceryl transferase [Candidatus Levybacteria bacterium]|nr:prolipoprotein diacylglyceryl transferase [Candidatus Levybacteria bacterium]